MSGELQHLAGNGFNALHLALAKPEGMLWLRAALPTASMPDPHSRLIVAAGTVVGRPASSSAIRATLRLSSPA